jgi:hypothetical protein
MEKGFNLIIPEVFPSHSLGQSFDLYLSLCRPSTCEMYTDNEKAKATQLAGRLFIYFRSRITSRGEISLEPGDSNFGLRFSLGGRKRKLS